MSIIRIRVLHVRPGEPAEVIEVAPTLDAFRDLVGGNIDVVRLEPGVALYVNDDGLALGLATNRLVGGETLVGSFVVFGTDESEEVSLTEEQAARWKRRLDNAHGLDTLVAAAEEKLRSLRAALIAQGADPAELDRIEAFVRQRPPGTPTPVEREMFEQILASLKGQR